MKYELNGYLRERDVLSVLPIGRSTWWALVKSGVAPKPIKLGSRCTAWRRSEVEAFPDQLAQKAA